MVMSLRKLTKTVPVVLALTVLFPVGPVVAAEMQDTTKAIQALAVREAEVSKNLDLTEHQNILGPVSTESAEPRTGSFIDLSSEIDHSIETSLAKFFETSQPPEILPRRGAKEAKLYREVSPGIVLIIAGEDTLGSGSIISSDGLVLTNWHVIRGQKKVVVVFKPPRGSEIREQDVFIAIVVKIDEIADLALVKILTPPANMTVLKLGKMNKIEVGIDVHAIGHPIGETWTYTRGIVSQLRPTYEWSSEKEFVHKASVVQTQTPISPGNSGGPLLTDAYEIIGINSFKKPGESLNFAVSVEEIWRFMKRTGNRLAERDQALKSSCEAQYDEMDINKNGVNDLARADTNCDGRPDQLLFDEDEDGIFEFALLDRNYDGRFETRVVDSDKNGKWDIWLVDKDGDGKFDVTGVDTDGDGKVDRYKNLQG